MGDGGFGKRELVECSYLDTHCFRVIILFIYLGGNFACGRRLSGPSYMASIYSLAVHMYGL